MREVACCCPPSQHRTTGPTFRRWTFRSAPARQGINLPNALVRQFNVTPSYGRDEAFAELFPLIKHTLWEGRHVLVAVTCRAILMGESLREAEEHVKALRDVELDKVR